MFLQPIEESHQLLVAVVAAPAVLVEVEVVAEQKEGWIRRIGDCVLYNDQHCYLLTYGQLVVQFKQQLCISLIKLPIYYTLLLYLFKSFLDWHSRFVAPLPGSMI